MKTSRIICAMNTWCCIVFVTAFLTKTGAGVLLNKFDRTKPPWISMNSSWMQHPPTIIFQTLDKNAPVHLHLPSRTLHHYLNWMSRSSPIPFHLVQTAGHSTSILLTVSVAQTSGKSTAVSATVFITVKILHICFENRIKEENWASIKRQNPSQPPQNAKVHPTVQSPPQSWQCHDNATHGFQKRSQMRCGYHLFIQH